MKGRFFGLNPDFFRQTLSCLFLVVVLTTCFNPLDYSPSGNNGLISIALPGAGPAKAAITPGDLTYELTFSGPGGQSITRTAAWGETCTVEVSPGLWTVTVTARDASAVKKAFGETVIDVIAGSRNSADIKLAVYTDLDLTGTFAAPVPLGAPDAFLNETQYTGTIRWSPDHTTFADGTIYTATVSLTAAAGYTFAGLGANSFSYAGATSATTTVVNSGTATVTITFPVTAAPTMVNDLNLTGTCTAPVTGVNPVSSLNLTTTQYTAGNIRWSPDHTTFASGTIYTAAVTLNAAAGYTFAGVSSFTYTGSSVIIVTNSGTAVDIEITFPITATTVSVTSLNGKVTAPVTGDTPVTTAIDTGQYTGTVAWTKDDDSSFSGSFLFGTIYKAVVTLSAKTGFTFTGVAADSFTYTDVTGAIVTNAVNSGTVTIRFPVTGPIPISDQAGLVAIGATAASKSASYILTGNITTTITAPICTDSNPFKGTLDGNGYTINVSISSSNSNVGLFAHVDTTGIVRNVTVTGTVSGEGNVGAIAGKNSGTIDNCSVNVTVSSTATNAGGIVGDNRGTIQDCNSTGTVTLTGVSSLNAGGIAGENSTLSDGTPEILRCFSSATVTAENRNAGGIVGSNNKGSVKNCYSSGNIGITGLTNSGGIVGSNYAAIENCYSSGTITGYTNAGGIVGGTGDTSTVTNCYSSSSVSAAPSGSGDGNAGGIVGSHTGGRIENCVALNSQISGGSSSTYRVAGYQVTLPTPAVLDSNYGRSTGISGNPGAGEKTSNGRNGQDVSFGTSTGQYNNQSFWEGLGWIFSGTPTPAEPWKFEGGLPKLYFLP
jgi:hypothetical protein